MRRPKRYAVFYCEEIKAYFVGTRAECETFIQGSGTQYGWNLIPLADCSREQTKAATA